MRDYTSGKWGFSLVWGVEASVFPRAFVMALPNAIVCFVFATLVNGDDEPVKVDSDRAKHAATLLSAFTSVLFFVLYFRSNVAYSRWWEGGTLLQQTRGEWFNAYSSLIAFSAPSPEMVDKVEEFHHLLARLMSMLFCAGLQQVSPNKDRAFEIICLQGIESESLEFLTQSPDKVEVLLQWIQRSTILNMYTGVLPIPPPVMSRAFQEISRGIVNLQNARKIADFPFPFPYAQCSMVMLLLHWVCCPIIASLMLQRYLAAFACFVAVFFLWCVNFIALQLESPFGDGENDLPMQLFQRDWNKSVGTLLAKRAQHPPKFYFDAEYHRKMHLVMSDGTQTSRRRLTSHLIERDEGESMSESMSNHRVESKATIVSSERAESKATNASNRSSKSSKARGAKAAVSSNGPVSPQAEAASSEDKTAPPAKEAAEIPVPADAKEPVPASPPVGRRPVGTPATAEVLQGVVEDALGSQLESIASPETPPCGSVMRGIGDVLQQCKCDTTDPVLAKLDMVDGLQEIDVEQVVSKDANLKPGIGVRELPLIARAEVPLDHAESIDTGQRPPAATDHAAVDAEEGCPSSFKAIDTGQPPPLQRQLDASRPSDPVPAKAESLPAQTIGTSQLSAGEAGGDGHSRGGLGAADVPGDVAIVDLDAVEAVDMNQAVVQASGTGNAPAKAIDEAAQPTGTGQCPAGSQRGETAQLGDVAVNMNHAPASIIGNGAAISKGGKNVVDANSAHVRTKTLIDTIDPSAEVYLDGGRTPAHIGRSQSPDHDRGRAPHDAGTNRAHARSPSLAASPPPAALPGDQENLAVAEDLTQATGPAKRTVGGLSQPFDPAADATDAAQISLFVDVDDAPLAAGGSGNSASLTAFNGASPQVVPPQAALPTVAECPPADVGRRPDAGEPPPREGGAPVAIKTSAAACPPATSTEVSDHGGSGHAASEQEHRN